MNKDDEFKRIRLDMVTDDDYMSAFRQNIQKYLSVISLRQLSDMSGVPFETIKSFMYSNTGDCKLSLAVKLAKALNISIDELIGSNTISKETKQSMAMVNMMSPHIINFVRWTIRDGFIKNQQADEINVMIPKWQDGLLATQDYQRIKIDAPPDIIGKTIMGIYIPCNEYMPNYSEGDIILVANDRLPKNMEHIVVHIGSQFWIMRKDITDHKTLKDNRVNNNGEYVGYICYTKRLL